MSLDVYIKSKKKEDREWVANITHNMNKMAQKKYSYQKIKKRCTIMFGDQKNCIEKYIPMR